MESNGGGKILNIVLACCGIFFLAMGLTDLGKDLFGTLLGLSVGLLLLPVFIWRILRQSHGKSIRIRPGNLALFCIALFFLMLGAAGIAQSRQSAVLGFSVGVPVGALYLWRRILEYRAADSAAEEEKTAAPVRVKAQQPMTICPHCGAPGKGSLCPYCGLDKRA